MGQSHRLPRFPTLKVPDHVPDGHFAPEDGHLLLELIHPILPQVAKTHIEGSLCGLHRVSLGHRHEPNLRRIPSRRHSGFGNPIPDPGKGFDQSLSIHRAES